MERLGAAGETFFALKPLCDRLAKEPNAQNAICLGNQIERHSSEAIQYHSEYIFLPIYVHLHNENLSKDTRQHLVVLLRTVISKTRITTLNCFLKLYAALIYQIYDARQADMLITGEEELKECTIKCLRDLIKRSYTDVIVSLYVGENAPKLSQAVYICLSIARTEKLCSLRVAAIESLMSLAFVDDDADLNDTALRSQAADMFMLFLPGIAAGLCQVARASQLENHRITMMSIRAYSRILSLVMEDNGDAEYPSICSEKMDKSVDPLGMRLKLEGDEGMKRYIETARRSREWFEAASTKLNSSIKSLMNFVNHSHFRVRKELAIAVKLMLSKCSRNMGKNLTVLVEILISLSEDKVEEVCEFARVIFNEEINGKFTRDDNTRPIVQLFEENLYKLLTKLPRVIRRSDDAIQLFYLNQLAGYTRLLGKERLPRVMASTSHLKRLVLALVYIAELDCTHVSLLDDVEIKDIQDTNCSNDLNSFKCFKFIRESWTEEKLMSVWKLTVELGDPVLLVDCIFELISEMPHYRKELTLLLNWLLTVDDTSMSRLYKEIKDYYTALENWYLPIQVQDDVTLGDAQSNVIYCCLLTEGLAIIGNNLREEYENYLLDCLYMVIERAGSGNSLLRYSGLKSLERIAHSQNYTNVADLLRDNVDYLSYHMTMKMRNLERNPGVLDVFSVLMKYSTIQVLPCPNQVVQVALSQLSVNQRNSYGLLRILYVFVKCVRKMTEGTDCADSPSIATCSTVELVVQSVLDYYNAKKDSERLDHDIIMTPDDIETELKDGVAGQYSSYDNQKDIQDDEEAKPPPPPPPYIKMTESVIKCCLNFLPSKEVPKSLLAMQIIEEGVGILSKWNEQLLPIVHELWHPMVERFEDPNILVINRAWQLLYTLAHVSQDFIRSRTLKQVLPSLSQFLMKSAKESYKKDSKSAYKFTQIFKLQKLILTQAATLAKNLKLHERQLWQMLTIAQPYLSTYQHPVLQQCCVQFFKDVAKFQADIVWVKCLSVWNHHVASISLDSKLTLEHLNETTITDVQSDYRTNIESILSFVEEISSVDV